MTRAPSSPVDPGSASRFPPEVGSRAWTLGERWASPVTVPGAPTGLVAVALKPRGVQLSWSAPSSTGGSVVTGYQIYRSSVSGAETLIATIGNLTTYADTSVTKGLHYYRVAAVNNAGTGALSAETVVTAK